MSLSICLRPTNTLSYLHGGGHLWFFLNWARGLRAHGCRVIWLEGVPPEMPAEELRTSVATLKSYLEPHGLAGEVALCLTNGEPLPGALLAGCLDLPAAAEADLLLNMRYDLVPEVVQRFRRSALVDIDPGLCQVWMQAGLSKVAPHDVYFTIGETVGRPRSLVPDCGLEWHYAPPPVYLPAWQPTPAAPSAPYTTVSQWWGEWLQLGGEWFDNSKRTSFLEYADLPQRTAVRLELALCLGNKESEEEERLALVQKGWSVRRAWDEIPTPDLYQRYIYASRGEFSCAKQSCMRLQNAWVSERSLCYLASGKPVVVQHTGPSRLLPDAEGFFRFRTPEEAAHALAAAEADYDRHCRLARALAEEHFDARKVVRAVLERALA
jgi:hypothetical protein